MNDLLIANDASIKDIKEVIKKLSLTDDDVELYGKYKAKVTKTKGEKNGKIILVTAINPTPYGEGKTTVSIGLADAFSQLGKNVSLALRQPSLGPVFGLKGGATGGGYSQVIPMTDINLHFTGDFHAITSANNLISAAIYNHIQKGNSLNFAKVVFNRCLDVNDRSLRNISFSCNDEIYEDHFKITAASEIMALFCLAKDLDDLKKRLANIIVGFTDRDEAIYVKDLKLEGALTVLLKDAFNPNLVQTLENTPAFIHGGPFANIAHGCSSLKSLLLAKSLSDYVITEAGFGSDLGAEKFLDIVCPLGEIKADVVVLVVTVRALKYNGDGSLEKGISNLQAHLDHLKHYGVPLVVAINKFSDDTSSEIDYVLNYVKSKNIEVSICDAYSKGGEGAIPLANKVFASCSLENNFKPLVSSHMSITDKLKRLGEVIYHASEIEYSPLAQEKLNLINKLGLSQLPICVAKTQYSISDDAKKLGYPIDNKIVVKDLIINNGAGFITVLLGKINTMPGLPVRPNYEKIDLVDGKIVGIF